MTGWSGFCGSRSLPAGDASLVAACVRALPSGRGVAVGCAAGADQLALSAALSSRPVQLFAVGGHLGAGFWSGSAPFALLRAASLRPGCSVTWWAGGGPSVPLVARLAQRSLALVRFLAARPGSELIAFFGSSSSVGTLRTCQAADAAGSPVIAFAVGFPPADLPSLGDGLWRTVNGRPPYDDAFLWVPAVDQPSLF